MAQLVKNLPAMQETWDQSWGWENPLEKGKATHSNILAWRIPWTVQSMGSQRVRKDWVTLTSLDEMAKIISDGHLKTIWWWQMSWEYLSWGKAVLTGQGARVFEDAEMVWILMWVRLGGYMCKNSSSCTLKVKKLKCLRNRSETTRGLMFVLFCKYTSFSTIKIKPYSLQKKKNKKPCLRLPWKSRS